MNRKNKHFVIFLFCWFQERKKKQTQTQTQTQTSIEFKQVLVESFCMFQQLGRLCIEILQREMQLPNNYLINSKQTK